MEPITSKARRHGWIGVLLVLGFLQPAYASEPAHSFGQLDPALIQILRVNSGPGEKVTPLRVVRWISSELTDTPMDTRTPPIEFQPIVRKHNSVLQVIAALSYQF